MVDKNSITWKAVSKLALELREKAINELISNPGKEEFNRGQIAALDEVLKLAILEKPDVIQSANYFDE